jgi:hypothetical protein
MENNQVDGCIYDKISRLARRNFEAMLDYYERDHGYESGEEFDMDEPDDLSNNTDSESKADEG